MTEPRWLDDDEMRAWRAFVTTTVRLFEQLDRELKAEHGLTHDDYAILVNLSEAPGQRMRMTELADRVLESKSRLSHHVGRLEADGLVERARSSAAVGREPPTGSPGWCSRRGRSRLRSSAHGRAARRPHAGHDERPPRPHLVLVQPSSFRHVRRYPGNS